MNESMDVLFNTFCNSLIFDNFVFGSFVQVSIIVFSFFIYWWSFINVFIYLFLHPGLSSLLFLFNFIILSLYVWFESFNDLFFMERAAHWLQRSFFILTDMPVFFKVPQMTNTKTITAKKCLILVVFIRWLWPFKILKTSRNSNKIFDSWVNDYILMLRRVKFVKRYHPIRWTTS